MITNPEYLPKDRLKQELRKHGVTFNPSENKDYYVQLFRDKVMGGKEAVKVRSEFSSDEEFVKQSPRVAKKQQKHTPAKGKKTAPKADTFLSQVTTLTDEDLSEQLQSYGENVGPITSTTRTVYERKLAKLRATGGGGGNVQSKSASRHEEEVDYHKNDSFIGEWSGDESDTTEDSEAAPPAKQRVESHTHVKKRHVREERTHVAAPLSGRGVDETEQKRRHKPSSSKHSRSAHSAPLTPPTSWTTVWSIICSLLLLLVMFAVAFLVYQHYTCPEGQDSLILVGWKKAGVLVVQMREMILKEPEAQSSKAAAQEQRATEFEPKIKKKKIKAKKVN